jgi:murein DD-endopeptidase MepM/ murein hydrolase activator NlpD
VQVAAAGVVAEARTFTGYGHTVIIDHENGIKTLYAHCSSLAVQKGEIVEIGQVIAYVGKTGRATSPHLHFAVMLKGVFMDPIAFLMERPRQFASKP